MSGRPEASISKKKLPHFFFVQERWVYDDSAQLTRDECLVYLLVCSGYSPRAGGATVGAKAGRELLGMGGVAFRRARAGLESRGLIHCRGPETKHPLTVIATAGRPFGPDLAPRDGHAYGVLAELEDLVLIPMALVYADRHWPESCLESLESAEAARLLLHSYYVTSDTGEIPSHRLWAEAEGTQLVLKLRARDASKLGIRAAAIADAGRELLESGLLFSEGDVDGRGRLRLRMRHVIQDPGKAARSAGDLAFIRRDEGSHPTTAEATNQSQDR